MPAVLLSPSGQALLSQISGHMYTGGTIIVPSKPLNVLTRNCGNGMLEVQWDAPASGDVAGYNLYISSDITKTGTLVNAELITRLYYWVTNLPFGVTVYTRVVAVDIASEESPNYSDQALDATVAPATTTLRFSGPAGDIIPAGTIFAGMVGSKQIGLQVQVQGVLTP